jgi:hypothetical protein
MGPRYEIGLAGQPLPNDPAPPEWVDSRAIYRMQNRQWDLVPCVHQVLPSEPFLGRPR